MQFPIVRKVSSRTLADDIIGVRPNESYQASLRRHLIEQRNKKIDKIRSAIITKRNSNPSKNHRTRNR